HSGTRDEDVRPNGSRLRCGRRARGRTVVEQQIRTLAGEATRLFPACERPAASSLYSSSARATSLARRGLNTQSAAALTRSKTGLNQPSQSEGDHATILSAQHKPWMP